MKAVTRVLLGLVIFMAGTGFIGWRMDAAKDLGDVLAWFGVYFLWLIIAGAGWVAFVTEDEA